MSQEDLKEDLKKMFDYNKNKPKIEMNTLNRETRKDFRDFRDIKEKRKFSVIMGK